jgi:DNA-binding HxlR family transcriptional regulator
MTLGDEQFLRDLYNLKYLFGDKWAPAIIVALANGKMRRVELRSTVKSYSIGAEWSRSGKPAVLHDTMLSRTLKNMTEKGLLVRTRRTDTFPREVYYSLAPVVVEYLKVLEPAVEWARRNPDLIAQAQAYHRQHGDDVDSLTDLADLDEPFDSEEEYDRPDTVRDRHTG